MIGYLTQHLFRHYNSLPKNAKKMHLSIIFLLIMLTVFHAVEAADRSNTVMGFPAPGAPSPPRNPRPSSDPQPVNSAKANVWDHWRTESVRSSNGARQKTVALTLAGHTAAGMAKPIALYACQTATCANPSHKQQTEQDIKTRFKVGKAAIHATLDKSQRDIDHSKMNRKIHLHNYRKAKEAEEKGERMSDAFKQEYSAEKNQLEKEQIAKEQRTFYQHSKYLKDVVRNPHNYPSDTQIQYPSHNS